MVPSTSSSSSACPAIPEGAIGGDFEVCPP
jgi:hypothetical protein